MQAHTVHNKIAAAENAKFTTNPDYEWGTVLSMSGKPSNSPPPYVHLHAVCFITISTHVCLHWGKCARNNDLDGLRVWIEVFL